MKKEVFLAIGIGFALGLIITFGIWTANKSLNPSANPASPQASAGNSPSPIPSVTPGPAGSSNITVTAPVDNALVNTPAVTITGTVAPSAVVALTYPTGDQIVTAGQNGAFSADITLEGGYNLIDITAYDNAGTKSEKTLTVTYSTQKI